MESTRLTKDMWFIIKAVVLILVALILLKIFVYDEFIANEQIKEGENKPVVIPKQNEEEQENENINTDTNIIFEKLD